MTVVEIDKPTLVCDSVKPVRRILVVSLIFAVLCAKARYILWLYSSGHKAIALLDGETKPHKDLGSHPYNRLDEMIVLFFARQTQNLCTKLPDYFATFREVALS